MSIIYVNDKYNWSFNNSIEPTKIKNEINVTYTETFGTEGREFNNSFTNSYKNRKLLLSFSSTNFFSFESEIKEIIDTSKNFKLAYSETSNFVNLFNGNTTVQDSQIYFSTGIFPYYENINLLDPTSGSVFSDFSSKLENTNVQGYWFDNSVPSKNIFLQSKVISYNTNDVPIQLSFRLPIYKMEFEYGVNRFNVSNNLSSEFNIFPKQDDTDNLNFVSDVVFSNNTLNWEWAPGLPSNVAANMEYNKVPGQVYLSNFEFYMGFYDNRAINYEFKNVYNDNKSLNIEMGMGDVSLFNKLQIEFFYGKELIDGLNFEITSEYSGHMNFQTLLFAPFNSIANFEYVKVKSGDTNINLEYKNVYIDNYTVNLESYSEINKDYETNYEFYIDKINRYLDFEFKNVYHNLENINLEINTSEIYKDYGSNFEFNPNEIYKNYNINYEFKNIFSGTSELNLEINTPEIYKNYGSNFETLVYANTNYKLNFEVLRFQEKRVDIQSYVISLKYKDIIIQININAFVNAELPFEVNVPELPGFRTIDIESNIEINTNDYINFESSIPEIWKDYSLNIEFNPNEILKDYGANYEFKNIYNSSDNINFESKSVIEKDFTLALETYVEINKNYELTLEYLAELPFDLGIDFESKTVINTETQLEIEYNIEAIQKDFGFNIESYIEINKDYSFNIEAFIDEVSKHFHFEFDDLDLVYYVISKGYNILPWNYSDGTGFWDINSNKNWNKTEDITTIQNGLLNQLSDKGLNIPDLIQYSDKYLDSFGVFIPGKSKDMNIQDSLLYFESSEDFTLVLGKRKKDPIETVELKEGNNLLIYDGEFSVNNIPTFDIIRNQISDFYKYCSIWDQKKCIWKTIKDNQNHELFFIENIDNQEQPIPYILMINVTEDCLFEIKR